jgi:serine/threonine protein kinase
MQDAVVARKEIQAQQHGDTNERLVLEALALLRHPNLVPFLGSYAKYGVENFLFTYVPMNLAQLFEMDREMPVHRIYLGMCGIADALAHIHDFSVSDGHVDIARIGYHHDLRPPNILVHGETFLLADFGLSQLKRDDQDSKSRLKGGHDDYLGPEAFNQHDLTNGKVGRALDIWSLGCILAEAATFIENRSVTTFRELRETTYGIDFRVTDSAFHLGGKVRPTVSAWLQELLRDPCDKELPKLVGLVHRMLEPNPYRRIPIATVSSSLALSAIDSQIRAIDQAYLSLVEARVHQDNFNGVTARLYLEHKRFKSWELAFRSQHENERLERRVAFFGGLSEMLNALTCDTLTHSSDENPGQGQEHVMAKIWGAYDSLSTCLSGEKQQQILISWTRMVCEENNTSLLDAIRSVSNVRRYRVVGASVAMRYMSRLLTDSISLGQRSRYIEPGCVQIDSGGPTDFEDFQHGQLIKDGGKVLGFLHGGSAAPTRVLVEWLEYDTRWQEKGNELMATMNALTNLLDPNVTPREGAVLTRVVSCCGFFHEQRNFRFGFLYPLTAFTSVADAMMYSLNNVIRMTDPQKSLLESPVRPDLGSIFTLAAGLAACLHALHIAGWLHKSISSHHLLVFAPSPSLVHEHVASAVLAGFHNSRPEAASYTIGPRDELIHYRHPSYTRGKPFGKAFDYFGLGIVLLELGLWQPVSVLRDDHPEIRSDEDFRRKLLESYVPQLSELVGIVYRDAVLFCLDAERLIANAPKPPGDSMDGHGQDLFRSAVVEPLSRCYA